MPTIQQLFIDNSGRIRSGWRLLIFVFVFGVMAAGFGLAATGVFWMWGIENRSDPSAYFFISSAFSLVPAVLAGWLCGKFLEKVPFRALGAAFSRYWLRHFASGFAIGGLAIIIAVAVAAGGGGLSFEFDRAAGPQMILRTLISSLAVFAVAGAFEEVLFRGYILQTFTRSGLAWVAILGTSVFFGVGHLGNPDASVASTVNTVLAGVWFSLAYLKTRDLWFPFGMHLAWNWLQGAFFGIEVSGLTTLTTAPLLKEIDRGPAWLTGETYGIEGGIACTAAIVISIVVIHFLPGIKPDEEMLAMTDKVKR